MSNRLFSSPSSPQPSSDFHSLLGYSPSNVELYQLAFRHKSVSQDPTANNERLEFLGDALLTAILSEYLYQRFPDQKEGSLSQMRAKIESRSQLNRFGELLGLQEYLEVDKSLIEQDKMYQKFLLGNALEALIGAIYLDQGYGVTFNYVQRLLEDYSDIEKIISREVNYKGRLLEWAQQQQQSVHFTVKKVKHIEGHDLFVMAVIIDGIQRGEGEAFSKKEAEQRAAQSALQQ